VLIEGWQQVTAAANWMVTELYSRDVRRGPEAKMPPMPRVYLYPEARRLFPGLAPLTVASLEHTTQALYRATRYHVIWTHERSLSTYRYPVPLPVHNQSWKATLIDERPVVRVRLADRWWDLRLKGVQTSPDELLVAVDAQDGIWRYHGDHLPRWSAEYRKARQHFAEDAKGEPGRSVTFADRRMAVALKYQRRMQSAVREAAANLIGHAKRRRCARLRYDDSVRAFCPDFPFAALREWLRQQCDGSGIAFEYVTTSPARSLEDSLASGG